MLHRPCSIIRFCGTLAGLTLLACACWGPAAAKAQAGQVLFVDDDAPGGGDGAAWSTAYRFLQDALMFAADRGHGVSEIHIAQGTYTPDRNLANPAGSGDRQASFALLGAVSIRGGYLGLSARPGQNPNDRDIAKHETFLSGDLAGDDGPPGSFTNTAENSYHVVVAVGAGGTPVLDGFSVIDGRADGADDGPTPQSQDQGSAVNVYYCAPTLINCTIKGNWTANHGAVNDHGGATLINCSMRNNFAGIFGAGLYTDHGIITVANSCAFIENTTPGKGGGAYSRGMRGAGFLGCDFLDNSADEGGGIYISAGSEVAVTNCSICFNLASRGGAIYAENSNPAISGSTIFGNIVSGGGGGLYNDISNPSISNSTFNYNIADGGGGGMWNDNSSPTIDSCTLSGNSVGGGGGGMYNNAGAPVISNCIFNGNTTSAGGAGMWNGQSNPTIVNCSFTGNQAASGAGVYNGDNSTSTITGCTFSNNLATEGGGLYNLSSDSFVSNCTFIDNVAYGGRFAVGGGLNSYFCNPTIIGCTFIGNTAEFGGGGLYNEGESPSIINCTFRRNSADGVDQGWGGGLLNGYDASATISNCLFNGNTANQGGAIFNFVFSTPAISNCTIVGNAAVATPDGGGGIYTYTGSTPTIHSCIVWKNVPGQTGGIAASINYSCVQGGYSGVGNISANPYFYTMPTPGSDGLWGTDDDNYGSQRLLPGSPCIDAADNTGVPTSVTVDLDGNPRFVDDSHTPDTGHSDGVNAIVDMGAYEYQALCWADIAPSGGDGVVNVDDLTFLLAHWGFCPDCAADIAPPGGNNVVNVEDILELINTWGSCG